MELTLIDQLTDLLIDITDPCDSSHAHTKALGKMQDMAQTIHLMAWSGEFGTVTRKSRIWDAPKLPKSQEDRQWLPEVWTIKAPKANRRHVFY